MQSPWPWQNTAPMVAVNYYPDQSEKAALVVEEIEKAGGRAFPVAADVTKVAEVEAMVDAVVKRCGSLDILVNNAGITRDQLLLRITDQDWEAVLATNLNGTFYCTRAALKGMVKNRWGRVVSLTSVVGVTGNVGQANYAASKAGIIGFTKSVAKEVGSRGITVNAVAPGFVRTEMTDRIPPQHPGKNVGLDTARAPRGAGGYCRSGGIFSITGRRLYNGTSPAR